MKLRPYQLEACSAILKTWQTNRSHLCVVATGGGKNAIAAGTSSYLLKNGARVLFLANRNELCQQPIGTFRDQTGIVPSLEKATFKASLNAELVIASVQTLSRQTRLERFPRNHFSHIFADEAHMAAADSWRRIFDWFPAAKVAGLTATPFRSDNKSLSDIFETESFRADLFSLVDAGWLVNPDHVDRLSTAISLADVRVKKTVTGYDYDPVESAAAIEPYFQEVAREILQRHAQRRILAFLPLIASSQKFVQACLKVGLHAVHIDGEDPDRDQKIAAFRDGKITLLSNSNLLHTGLDFPSCDCTLNLRPTRSKVLYAQIVGRSTRALPGVLDGLESAEQRLAAIKASPKPKSFILDPLWVANREALCTPSFLVAPNEEFAQEMEQKAGRSYSLRAVRDRIQAEREESIRRRLEAVARFREGIVPANYFGAAIRDDQIVNYEAIFKWEEQPPTKFSRLLLGKAGIDPDTVPSEGLARQVLQAIGRRRYQGLPEIRELAAVAHDQGVTEDLWKLTKSDLLKACKTPIKQHA